MNHLTNLLVTHADLSTDEQVIMLLNFAKKFSLPTQTRYLSRAERQGLTDDDRIRIITDGVGEVDRVSVITRPVSHAITTDAVELTEILSSRRFNGFGPIPVKGKMDEDVPGKLLMQDLKEISHLASVSKGPRRHSLSKHDLVTALSGIVKIHPCDETDAMVATWNGIDLLVKPDVICEDPCADGSDRLILLSVAMPSDDDQAVGKIAEELLTAIKEDLDKWHVQGTEEYLNSTSAKKPWWRRIFS